MILNKILLFQYIAINGRHKKAVVVCSLINYSWLIHNFRWAAAKWTTSAAAVFINLPEHKFRNSSPFQQWFFAMQAAFYNWKFLYSKKGTI